MAWGLCHQYDLVPHCTGDFLLLTVSAQGLSGHTSPHGDCVCFNLEDFAPPEAEEDYLPFSWPDFKCAHLVHCEEMFDFELELLTSLCQA